MESEAVNHYNCIYKLTSPSGKVYIGQATDFNRRIKTHQLSTQCKAIHNAILKYGIDSFTIEILKEDINPSDLDKWEKYYIKQFDSFNTGYNLTIGGDSVRREDGHHIKYMTGKYGVSTDNPDYNKVVSKANTKRWKAYNKQYYHNNIETEHERIRIYREQNKDKLLEQRRNSNRDKKYRETHREIIRLRNRIYHAKIKAIKQNNGQMTLSAYT